MIKSKCILLVYLLTLMLFVSCSAGRQVSGKVYVPEKVLVQLDSMISCQTTLFAYVDRVKVPGLHKYVVCAVGNGFMKEISSNLRKIEDMRYLAISGFMDIPLVREDQVPNLSAFVSVDSVSKRTLVQPISWSSYYLLVDLYGNFVSFRSRLLE